MRIPCLLFFLLCFSATIKSQVPANAVALEDTAFNAMYAGLSIPRVTGKLLHLSAEELKKLPITYSVVTPFSESQIRKTVFAQTDGSFRLELDYAFPYQQIWFGVGELFYTGLYANKDLYLELDMKKIKAAKEVSFNGDGVRYLGSDGPLNVYLNNYVLYKRPQQLELSGSIYGLLHSSRAVAGNILPDYNKLFDSVKIIEDSYIAANPSPYSWILENERMSDYYAQICTNYWWKTMDDTLWQKMKQHKSYLVSNNSAGFYSYMAIYISTLPGGRVSTNWKDVAVLPDLDVAEKALIDSLRDSEKMQPVYPYTLENIKKWSEQLQPRIQKIALMRSLDKSIQRTDSIFSSAKADFLKLRLNTSKDVNEQKVALDHILRSMHTAWCIAVVKKEYKRTADKIDEINKILARSAGGTQHTSFGKPLMETSFGASMYKVSGIKAVDFLAKLKQSFPGKAIIIDLWATWCSPCLGEMPHGKKLQEASKDLPVIFVYLCTIHNSTESKWKSKVMELKQPGIHFLIDETLDAELAHYFSFSGYPGHAFIDKTGIYRPGASDIENREALVTLINK
ncbi:thiol-disulfide isomerase/thioredoxin [Chitinophaga niastensis]|uniref:Thiol-disulfide isomerase/thioredoxin n=1 Tax=Chitinophaga niastensis TaxID=536980 RepID=A0A2P8HJ94_CHINA|nr:TlpA disulfide reductase family protein [Chitinophaga niastensis]PSL46284.1 thiol-disulfide isomerase/thioredoxin [Chitinophaga niastensis]